MKECKNLNENFICITNSKNKPDSTFRVPVTTLFGRLMLMTDQHCLVYIYSTEGELDSVVFAHQTVWQQHIMSLFAKEICLIDATYNTSLYDLPLFFLCAATNVGYVNVATLLLADERTETIQQGLEVIKQWNPMWQPKYFMSDFCEAQINALEATFPGWLMKAMIS